MKASTLLALQDTFIKLSETLLGGSWVVINGVISPLIGVITIVTLITGPLISSHEPPSKP